MKNNNIKLSIVTVTYNCSSNLEKTLKSVLMQFDNIDCSNLEYVIIDGLSSDDTLEVARKYFEIFEKYGVSTKLISEKDSGIYDAMNKGIKNSNGKYINMLNAGDEYYDSNVLIKFFNKISISNADIIYGNTIRVSKFLNELWIPGNIENIKKRMIFCHQSLFIKRDLSSHFYNLKYKCCADYDLILRLFLEHKSFDYLDEIICKYSLDGITANSSMITAFKEINIIRIEHNVLKNNIFNSIVLFIGICKRKLILILPESVKWKISQFLNVFRKSRKY